MNTQTEVFPEDGVAADIDGHPCIIVEAPDGWEVATTHGGCWYSAKFNYETVVEFLRRFLARDWRKGL